MCTLLAKLAIGLSATVVATGFYHLAAAPPALAATDVCGPGNFSSACVPDNSLSPQSPATQPDPQPESPVATPEPVQQLPTVSSPVATPEPVPLLPTVSSPVATPEPVPLLPTVQSPVATPEPVPLLPTVQSPVATPEPVPLLPTVQSPVATPEPVPLLPTVQPAPAPNFNIYVNAPALRATSIPEPGTVAGLLLIGAGIIYSGRKRNKQVGQQR